MGMKGHGKNEADIENLVGKLNALLKEQEAEVDRTKVTLTKNAANKFLEVLREEGKEGYGLRFGDTMSGCSGFEYILDFSEKAEDNDEVFESHGIEIHVDKGSLNRLLGSVIDYADGLHGSGFKISNPNARSSCGCGSSHSY